MARARLSLAAGAFFTDFEGRVLLVEPTYKPTWEIPGGVVDPGESPVETCRREVREELGLDREIGALLVVDFCLRPYVRWEGLRFVFAGGVLTEHEASAIRLPDDELRSWTFATIDEARAMVAEPLWRRIATAAAGAAAAYLENGRDPGAPEGST